MYALRAFEVAARLNSFSKAAETLNITPGAVSRHVRTLELWFDCELFKRQGPRVEVTEAGRVLAGQLNESFTSIEWACRAFRSENHLLRLKSTQHPDHEMASRRAAIFSQQPCKTTG
ncbi:LysR family transcriptional regulator [Enterobacter hormaechei]